MHYITEIGLTSRFFQVYHAYHTVYHKNSGTLPLKLVRFAFQKNAFKVLKNTTVYIFNANIMLTW